MLKTKAAKKLVQDDEELLALHDGQHCFVVENGMKMLCNFIVSRKRRERVYPTLSDYLAFPIRKRKVRSARKSKTKDQALLTPDLSGKLN